MECQECGFPIIRHQKYLKNDKDGTILCFSCFKKLKKEGKIK
jgi:formylmethanofuran dehydrogenase subunit E